MSAGQVSRVLAYCWLSRHTSAGCALHLCPHYCAGSAGAQVSSQLLRSCGFRAVRCPGSTDPSARLCPFSQLYQSFGEADVCGCLVIGVAGKPTPPHPFCDKHQKLYVAPVLSTSHYIYNSPRAHMQIKNAK